MLIGWDIESHKKYLEESTCSSEKGREIFLSLQVFTFFISSILQYLQLTKFSGLIFGYDIKLSDSLKKYEKFWGNFEIRKFSSDSVLHNGWSLDRLKSL